MLLPGKNNLAPEGDGLAFTIGGDPPCISWERDPVAMSADDALALENGGEENRKPGPEPRARKAAEEWLSGLLEGVEVPADQIKEEAAAAGLNYRTVQRAADALGVIREKNGFSKAWQWRFPKPGRVADELEVTGSQGNKNLSTCHLVEFDAKTAVLQCQDPEEDKSSDLVALDMRDKHNGRERGKL